MNSEAIHTATNWLSERGFGSCTTAVILGTGLSGFAEILQAEVQAEYESIPGFPVSTVESHHGRLLQGTLDGHRLLVMQGRFHFYEGYSMGLAALPIRVMRQLGVQRLLISNAAGSLNPKFEKGSLMLLTDHINLQPGNPLIGPNDDRIGTRFPDMSIPYDQALGQSAKRFAREQGIALHAGVYAAVAGPNLETRAEYRFLRRIGADAVGMSTVPEVIAARHAGMAVAAVSVLTDTCDPDHLAPVSLAEIIAVAAQAEPNLTRLFRHLVHLP